MEISVGDRVEICCNEEGFFGSYFEARIVRRARKDKVVVEYTNLVTEDDENKKLREVVDVSAVRPLPPPEMRVGEYELLDVVDAYDNDGWWVGRITGMDRFNYYCVYFESYDVEIVYPVHKLRIHQEFENGCWVTGRRKGPTATGLPFRSLSLN